MKRKIGLTLSVISLAIFVLLYLIYDSKGYEYGLGCDLCKKEMPYGLKPIFYSEYPQRFYLLDKDCPNITCNTSKDGAIIYPA